jgi:hypothetical protein
VRKALAGQPVTEALLERLSARQDLTPAQIHTAVRFATLASGEGAGLDALIERQLAHADQALGRRRDRAQASPAVTRYSLDLLHVESRHPVPRIVQALQASGHGTLCFHGAPGSGKSALAVHIAQALAQPLHIRQASDLMSKYVGETEQNMAAMFAEAERAGAVLLLDEADSFLQDRRGAQRHYEVSEVNEMLQGMERFRGVFICTTNLMDQLDAAALRRFAFKVQFLPLRREQREAMFIAEALHGDAQALAPAWRERLAQLDQLCLGDFAAVQRQAQILAEAHDGETFLCQLEAEHRLKPGVRERRGLGFLN